MYRSGAPVEAWLFPILTAAPPSRSKALPFFVLGEVTPSWSNFTRKCFLSRSLAGFRLPAVIPMVTDEEQEEDEESRSPMEATALTGLPDPEFPLPKVE